MADVRVYALRGIRTEAGIVLRAIMVLSDEDGSRRIMVVGTMLCSLTYNRINPSCR